MRTLVLAGVVLALGGAPLAASAQAGKDRPITRTWKCENGRELQLNFNPRRINEEAWLTYGGDRTEVHRKRSASGVAYASKDGKVKMHEKDGLAEVEVAGITEQPVRCSRVVPKKKK